MDVQKIQKLYQETLRIRLIEEEIAKRYSEQMMRCPVHLSIGQEGVAAGVCSNLYKDDYMVSTHRSHGHYLAKGGDLDAMIAELYGKKTGCCNGKGGSMHLIDLNCGFLGAVPIVGSTIPIGVGAAFSSRLSNEEKVTVIFLGDGACEEGVFHESINFAALKKIPVIFLCENNLYSVYSNISVRQPENRSLINLAEGHGVKSYKGDGNNAIEVSEISKEAIEYSRSGAGPTFLEFSTYRHREHCGPNFDNDIGYRTVQEYEEWLKLCPILFLEKELSKLNIDTNNLKNNLTSQFSKEINLAFDKALASDFPTVEEMQENLFSE